SLYAYASSGMDFFWELSTLITIMLWGHFIEMKSVLGASRALEALARLLPKKANLIKDSDILEVDVIIFDKTGTLTEGRFGVSEIYTKDIEEKELLKLVASIEINSEHVIAKAIVEEAINRGFEVLQVRDFRVYPGKGVWGVVEGYKVAVGTDPFMRKLKIAIDKELLAKGKRLKGQGKTLIFVGINGSLRDLLALSDRIREESYSAVRSIKNLGKKVMMITGDGEEVAKWVSEELGIDEYFAEVLPHQKADIVKGLQKMGLKVAMVGDGINDAPALAQADVGIAIGSGTEVAIESAGIILVKSNPEDVPRVIRLSKIAYRKMIQNLLWATGYNLVAIPLASGLFYRQGLLLPPTFGAVLMSLSTVLVAINALLMRRSLE
ncbi:MAG: HAD-IC family P-type ATPase, partial [Aquificaceae bacterium]